MKIAIASQDKKQVTGHAGRCQKFWIYETDEASILDKSLLELTPAQSFHNSSPQSPHPLDTVQVLISGSLGKGLARRLENHGIEGIITSETDPETAVLAYLNGSLVRESPEHHDHHHGHEHHHGHGHGCH
jgi:predicted Fe-Mo cluster-binding NifX family protein